MMDGKVWRAFTRAAIHLDLGESHASSAIQKGLEHLEQHE